MAGTPGSATWAVVASKDSVQPVGGATVADVLLGPTPPTSIAPGVTVVTPGTVRPVADTDGSTAVEPGVSNGVTGSTPRKAVIPPFHFCAVDSRHV